MGNQLQKLTALFHRKSKKTTPEAIPDFNPFSDLGYEEQDGNRRRSTYKGGVKTQRETSPFPRTLLQNPGPGNTSPGRVKNQGQTPGFERTQSQTPRLTRTSIQNSQQLNDLNTVERQRKGSVLSSRYDDENEWGCTNWCEYVIVVVLAALLLIASLTLTLFWIMYYREGFSWDTNPKQQFNLHPVLMVAGFITFSGFSILLYRICRCFRRIYVKLMHTIFHALAIPCIVVGFLAVLEYHNNTDPPIPNFYSMHSWLGFITMGLFGLQFVFGFFSFLILLCCEGATAAFRASMVPIHASFGLTTFMLAIATCLTGLTEKAIFSLGSSYSKMTEESIIVNSIAMVLTALAIVVSYICMREEFRFRGHVLIRSGDL